MILMFLFSLISVYVGFTSGAFKDNRSQDYQWGPSKALLEHQNPFKQWIDYKDGKIDKPFMMSQAPNYPASAYIFLWPYASLDWESAKLSWAISNLIFTVMIFFWLKILFPIKRIDLQVFAVMIFIGGASWRTVLGNGQHSLFVIAFFIWAIVFANKSKLISGLLLSIAWFKYTITFPLSLFFLYKKNYNVLLISTVIHIILTLFVSYWIDQPVTQFFLGHVQVATTATGIGDIDIIGIVQRYELPSFIAVVLGLILLAMVTRVIYQKKEPNDLLIISFLSFVSLALFFHLAYDFVVLIFPLWLLFSVKKFSKLFKGLLIGLIILKWYLMSVTNIFLIKLEYTMFSSLENLFVLSIIIIYYVILISMYRELTNTGKTQINRLVHKK
ncbi:MAG: glycosyltransferase 87 family protein [Pseudomonadota bacterium]